MSCVESELIDMRWTVLLYVSCTTDRTRTSCLMQLLLWLTPRDFPCGTGQLLARRAFVLSSSARSLLAGEFVCEPLHYTVSLLHDGDLEEDTQIDGAYQHQLSLRKRDGCRVDEWQHRCPFSSTMLLASTSAGCSAAGCVAVQGVSETALALKVR